jgi:hypothetical protein
MNYERKQIIEELQKIIDENEIIDFLRKYLRYEYATTFEKELDEEIKIIINNNNFSNKRQKGKDNYTFTLRKLKDDISKRLDIKRDYIDMKELMVIIFFEKLLVCFDINDEKYIDKNKEIEKNKKIYSFFIGLIANGICNLSKYNKVKKLVSFVTLTQEDLDNDEYHDLHISVARKILEIYLIPFIGEYKNYL